MPSKPACFVVLLKNKSKPLSQRLNLHRFSNGRYLVLTSRAIFQRLEVERENVFLLALRWLLINPLAGFVTQSTALELCGSQMAKFRVTQDLSRFIMFDQAVKVVGNC